MSGELAKKTGTVSPLIVSEKLNVGGVNQKNWDSKSPDCVRKVERWGS